MNDWQPGDLAVCVDDGRLYGCACGYPHLGNPGLSKGRMYRVARVGTSDDFAPGYNCRAVALLFTDGNSGDERRFRKIRPDEREACEPEFVTLLKRSKRKVEA